MDFSPDWILGEDESLLAVNKPAGVSTLVEGWNPQAPYLKGMLEARYGRLWTVHRLDKDTSGVLVFARIAEAHRHLNLQFESHTAQKIYHTIVVGSPEWDTRRVGLLLRTNADRKHRTVVDAQRGKPSMTELQVLERLGGFTLLQASPLTGRTHQIRAHLSAISLPISGDMLYGKKVKGAGGQSMSRVALHAFSLSLIHPFHQERMQLTAPYPDDFASFIEQLRREPGIDHSDQTFP